MRNLSHVVFGCILTLIGTALVPQTVIAQIVPKPQPRFMKMPDLVVTNVSFTVKGQFEAPNGVKCWNFMLNTTIKNRGSAATGKGFGMSIHRYDKRLSDGELVTTAAVPALGPGEEVTQPPYVFGTCKLDIDNNATLDPRNVFRVLADFHRDITESDETNNSREATFRLPMSHHPKR